MTRHDDNSYLLKKKKRKKKTFNLQRIVPALFPDIQLETQVPSIKVFTV